MSRACLRLLLAPAWMAFATVALAQANQAPSSKFAVAGSAASAPAAGKESRPRRHAPAARARPDAALVTFPGFRLLSDGRSRIYVELTKAVTVEQRRADGALVYVMRDARVPVRNNRNALITTHFPTPVARARVHGAGHDVALVIELRQVASATHRVVAADNGGARLEVDFPAGDYPPVPGLYDPTAKARAPEADTREAQEPAPPSGPAPTEPATRPPPGPAPTTAPAGSSAAPPPAR